MNTGTLFSNTSAKHRCTRRLSVLRQKDADGPSVHVSDDVARKVQMPSGLQALEDVEETMPSLPATTKDPGIPDQIVLDKHGKTRLQVSLGASCARESRGRNSPH